MQLTTNASLPDLPQVPTGKTATTPLGKTLYARFDTQRISDFRLPMMPAQHLFEALDPDENLTFVAACNRASKTQTQQELMLTVGGSRYQTQVQSYRGKIVGCYFRQVC